MRRPAALAAGVILVLSACTVTPAPSPVATASPSAPAATPQPSLAPSSAAATATAPAPTPSPEPSLALDAPDDGDERVVSVAVETSVPPDGDGELRVTVTSAADTRIDELVLRWPAELNALLFLAPFEPSEERIRDGGPPLVQPWTKWVVGPGERGEPAGTISLGWGPLLPGATLTIPILVTRLAPGPIAFDLQVLAGNDLLTIDGGDPAKLRVEVP
jgi:hypothetical protein